MRALPGCTATLPNVWRARVHAGAFATKRLEGVRAGETRARRDERARRLLAPKAEHVLALLAQPLRERREVRVRADERKAVNPWHAVQAIHRVDDHDHVRDALARHERVGIDSLERVIVRELLPRREMRL